MAEKTGIAWCHHTFNGWIGCTKVSPGCDHCYAEALDKRHRWKGAEHWGPGVPRMRTSPSNWEQPLRWDRKAAEANERRLVFCSSLADVFDNEVPSEWREDLFRLIARTPCLDWLLLTKRIGNATKMLPWINLEMLPELQLGGPWPNVWIGASVVNQEEADRDIPKLLATPAATRFVSYEPALGPIDFTAIPRIDPEHPHPQHYDMADLDWIIVGGESAQGGAKARPFVLEWAHNIIEQCRAAGVACFVKQLGSNRRDSRGLLWGNFKDRAGADPAEWPEDLRVQEFPA